MISRLFILRPFLWIRSTNAEHHSSAGYWAKGQTHGKACLASCDHDPQVITQRFAKFSVSPCFFDLGVKKKGKVSGVILEAPDVQIQIHYFSVLVL